MACFDSGTSCYQSTKTSCDEYDITYLFTLPFQLPSPRSLPEGGDLRPGPVPLEAAAPLAI